MIGQQLAAADVRPSLSCFRIFAERQELASFYMLEQNFKTNVMCLIEYQDGPSLESSSYLNMTFRYLGPLDPWNLGLLDF